MKYNKWQSRRFLFAAWAALLATWIVGNDMDKWTGVASALVAIIGAYILGDSYTKPKGGLVSETSKTSVEIVGD